MSKLSEAEIEVAAKELEERFADRQLCKVLLDLFRDGYIVVDHEADGTIRCRAAKPRY